MNFIITPLIAILVILGIVMIFIIGAMYGMDIDKPVKKAMGEIIKLQRERLNQNNK